MARREFGNTRKLPSGRWQARYTGPDGKSRTAPVTFSTKSEATGWLSTKRSEIERRVWRAPEAEEVTLAAYAEGWLASRELRARTRTEYRGTLDRHILPDLGAVPIGRITPTMVREWYTELGDQTGPTMRARAYGLLRTILGTAVTEDALAANPCRIRGGGSTKRASQTTPATVAEIDAIAEAMPPRYRALVLVSAWCGLRFGEATELRRSDIDLDAGKLHIRRAVVYVGRAEGEAIPGAEDGFLVGDPKSDAGRRTVWIPAHIVPALAEHLAEHAEDGPHGLVFPAARGGHMSESTLAKVYYPAREAVGRPDLRWHDLRHTAAVLAAGTPTATLPDVMNRVGHSTPHAAMRYQHMAEDRDAAIAAALSEAATGVVVPLRSRERGA